jgi:hypothetical protein
MDYKTFAHKSISIFYWEQMGIFMKKIFQILSLAITIFRPMLCMDTQPLQDADIVMEDAEAYRCTCGRTLPSKELFVKHCRKHTLELQAQQQYIQQKRADEMIASLAVLQLGSSK